MKLFLTSTGFSTPKLKEALMSNLGFIIDTSKILLVSLTKNEKEQLYVEESKKELKGMGFKDIYTFNLNTDKLTSISSVHFNLIYICGGNTFAILQKIKDLGLDTFIKSEINKGTVYAGVSAGSIIAGKTIEIAGWGSEADLNEVKLQNLSGFNFTDIAVFPHFRKALEREVEDFKRRVDYPVITLTNEQMLVINDAKTEVI
jgi:dipeptidase E